MHPLNETHELIIAIEKEQVPPTISKQIIWGTPSDIVSFPNLLENFVSVKKFKTIHPGQYLDR